MHIHCFQCNNDTYDECIERSLFGSVKGRLLKHIRPDDLTFLFNYTAPKRVYGLWKIIKAGWNLEPDAWEGQYQLQARVQQLTKDIGVKWFEEFKGLFIDSNGKMRDVYEGDDAIALAALFGYSLPTAMLTVQAASAPTRGKYHVPFFDEIGSTRDPKVFEDSTHDLLRLLGILNLHEIPRGLQPGRSDGFFKIGRLAVLYDATLNENHKEFKAQQVENFIDQLDKGRIELPPNRTESVKSFKKQVWIITRGTTCLQRKVDDIQVSEIGVTDLIRLYTKRLTEKWDGERLEDALAKLGS